MFTDVLMRLVGVIHGVVQYIVVYVKVITETLSIPQISQAIKRIRITPLLKLRLSNWFKIVIF
jgi:hypothetical protein